jgi:hypothetical protein
MDAVYSQHVFRLFSNIEKKRAVQQLKKIALSIYKVLAFGCAFSISS